MIRARHALTIRAAIHKAKANHVQGQLTAALARAYGWPAHVATHATLEALKLPVEWEKNKLLKAAYDRTLHRLPRIKVHHPGCGCGRKPES